MSEELGRVLGRLLAALTVLVVVGIGWLTADLAWLLIDMKDRLL